MATRWFDVRGHFARLAAQRDVAQATPYTSARTAGLLPSFLAQVLLDSPLIYYRLGEAAGTTVSDSSGNGNQGTMFGTAGTDWQRGVSGLVGDTDLALQFLTKTGYLRSNTQFSFNAQPFTLMAAIKVDNADTAGHVAGLYSSTDPTVLSGSRDRLMYVDSSGKLIGYIWNGAIRTVASPSAINDGQRRIVHLASSTGELTLYINGAQVATGAFNSTDSGLRYLFAGINNVSGQPGGANAGMKGIADEVAWFNTRLSAARILAQAQAALLA